MGREELEDKLASFFANHAPLTEECHVVYVLVEIRKLLDRVRNSRYAILRFYCDWIVHTDKSHMIPEMEGIMSQIFKEASRQIRENAPFGEKTRGFFQMEELHKDFQGFLQEYRLPMTLSEDANWREFVGLLIRILIDQPMTNPCPEIERFSFLKVHEGFVQCQIDFKEKIGEHSNYRFTDSWK